MQIDDDEDPLPEQSANDIRNDEQKIHEVAKLTGLSEATVRRRAKAAHPNTLVRNVFKKQLGNWIDPACDTCSIWGDE
jgi:hypothetical protein